MKPVYISSTAEHEAKVAKDLEGKPRPRTGWMNGWLCLWIRPGDAHLLAAGEVSATLQVQAVEAIAEHLQEPG